MPVKTVSRPHPATVYARTGKGVLSFKNGTANVSSEVKDLFSLIDGKASVAELRAQAEMDTAEVEKALDALEEKGYVKVFREGADQAVPDFTEVPADAPDLDFTAPGSLLEISVREARANAEQEPGGSKPVDEAPRAQARVAEGDPLQARIRELEAALAQAEEQVATERAARQSAEGEAKAAGRARNEAVKALAKLKTSAGEERQAGTEADAGSHEALAEARERISHMELQLATERETREKTVQTLRESQSQAEAGRNAAEMRVKEMEIALEQADKIDRQHRERLRQIEAQIESARRSRAEAEGARDALQAELGEAKAATERAIADGRQHAERIAQVEGELEAERRTRAAAEASVSAERESREKLARALMEIRKLIGSIEE